MFRRDLQAAIGAKANLNLGPTIENYNGETFLSQEVTINLLQESKLAFKRCHTVRNKSTLTLQEMPHCKKQCHAWVATL